MATPARHVITIASHNITCTRGAGGVGGWTTCRGETDARSGRPQGSRRRSRGGGATKMFSAQGGRTTPRSAPARGRSIPSTKGSLPCQAIKVKPGGQLPAFACATAEHGSWLAARPRHARHRRFRLTPTSRLYPIGITHAPESRRRAELTNSIPRLMAGRHRSVRECTSAATVKKTPVAGVGCTTATRGRQRLAPAPEHADDQHIAIDWAETMNPAGSPVRTPGRRDPRLNAPAMPARW